MNHAAVAVGHRVYSFGGYCSGEDYETLRQIDVHIFNAGKPVLPPFWSPCIGGGRGHLNEVQWLSVCVAKGLGKNVCFGTWWQPQRRFPGLSRAVSTVSLRWTKLPPVRPAVRGQAPVVPYMRYGHSTVLIDDTVFLWGGRNDTEGACNVLYAFDVSEYGSQMMPWAWERGCCGECWRREGPIEMDMSADLCHSLNSFKRYSQVVHTPSVRNSSWGPGWTFSLCPGQDHVHFWGI